MEKIQFEMLLDGDFLSDVLDYYPEGMFAHDNDRIILLFNRAAEIITGYKREEVVGRDCHEVFVGTFCGANCSFCQGPPRHWEKLGFPVNFITRGKKIKQLDLSAIGMIDRHGSNRGALVSFRDVSTVAGMKLWSGKKIGHEQLLGHNPRMIEIFKQIRDLAMLDYPVLVTGETGTGKELVAAAIHSESRRASGPFITVNCGAFTESVVESELFGHVKGSFTGAYKDKKGRFELAHNGTIFLDEIGELAKGTQVKLLRALENGTFERVGDEKTFKVNVRIISATNRDLKKEVERGNFRSDLFYRLNVVPIHLPPLRERKDDIPLLASIFLERERDPDGKPVTFSPQAIQLLVKYTWPGNVRELRNAVHFALAHARGASIGPESLPLDITADGAPAREGKLTEESVREALAKANYNKVRAARLLRVGRATLYRFLVSHETLMSRNTK